MFSLIYFGGKNLISWGIQIIFSGYNFIFLETIFVGFEKDFSLFVLQII